MSENRKDSGPPNTRQPSTRAPPRRLPPPHPPAHTLSPVARPPSSAPGLLLLRAAHFRLVFTVAPRNYHFSVQHRPHSRREASLRRVQHKHSHRRARNLALQSTSNHRLAQVVVAAPENGRMSAPPPRTGASINELLAPEQPERHQLAMARHVRKCSPAEVPSCSPGIIRSPARLFRVCSVKMRPCSKTLPVNLSLTTLSNAPGDKGWARAAQQTRVSASGHSHQDASATVQNAPQTRAGVIGTSVLSNNVCSRERGPGICACFCTRSTSHLQRSDTAGARGSELTRQNPSGHSGTHLQTHSTHPRRTNPAVSSKWLQESKKSLGESGARRADDWPAGGAAPTGLPLGGRRGQGGRDRHATVSGGNSRVWPGQGAAPSGTRGASAAEEFLQVENVKIHCAWL